MFCSEVFDRKSIEIPNDRILYVSKHIKSRNHRETNFVIILVRSK